MPEIDPTVARRKLKNHLRSLRESAQLSQSDVAETLEWSLSKVIRIETARVGLSVVDTRAMLELYGVRGGDPRLDELLDLARWSKAQAWYDTYRNVVSKPFAAYLGHESSAAVIRTYQPTLIPGLLQTDDYARVVLAGQGRTGDDLDAGIDLRIERQTRLDSATPRVRRDFVYDESAIRRVVGGPGVMRAQLRRLLEVAEDADVSQRIIPFEAGLLPYTATGYVLLEIPDEGDVLYLESSAGELVIHEGAESGWDYQPGIYLERFFGLIEVLDAGRTPDLLRRALKELED
jgi:transcriptional regulator with XRE-family HTH domain